MDRYKDIKIEKDNKYESFIFPTVDESDDDFYIITTEGLTLTYLANLYYHDTTKYFIIVFANENVLDGDSIVLQGGIRLRIPKDIDTYISKLES